MHLRDATAAEGLVRYDAIFLDIDGTLLWVDLDVEGYVEDLAPYSNNGELSAERVSGPVWESLRRHIRENIQHRTEKDLAGFKRRNAEITAAELGVEKPEGEIFEEALRVSGVERDRVVHVGNDLVTDVKGASTAGLDTVLVDRRGGVKGSGATYVIPDLSGLPEIVRG